MKGREGVTGEKCSHKRKPRVGLVLSDHVMCMNGVNSSWEKEQYGLKVYLDRSELHYRPDSLGNHVERLPPPRRDQGQISIISLQGKAQHYLLHAVRIIKLRCNVFIFLKCFLYLVLQ